MRLRTANLINGYSIDLNSRRNNKRKSWLSLCAWIVILFSGTLMINSCKDEETSPSPKITSFSPAKGGEGSEVIISGTNFNVTEDENLVMINTLPATVTNATETTLTIIVPVGATTGKVKVTVNENTSVSEEDFIVVSSSKVLGETGGEVTGTDGRLSIDLPQGALDANTIVSVEESNETATNGVGKVYTLSPEGTVFAEPVLLSFQYTDSDLAGASPSELAIAYKTGEEQWKIMETQVLNEQTKTITTLTNHFSQWTLLKIPTFTGFAPASGKPGDVITLTGTNFNSDITRNQVFFNDVPAQITGATTSSLSAKVPQGATTGKIKIVTVFNGTTYTLLSKKDFGVLESDPSVTAWFPSSGPIGTSVTIVGSGFSPNQSDNTVTFNGIAATVTFSSATQIVATVPAGATTGNIFVTTKFNNFPFLITAGVFTVTGNEPKITSFAPSTGSANTTVVIDGNNFSATASDNRVFFSGVEAQILQSSTTQITVKVPVAATTGKISVFTIFNTLNYVTTSATNFFVVSIDEPTLTTFTPATGTAGTVVTINGTGFSMNISENHVSFNGIPATVLTVATTGTSSILKAKVPAGATSGKITITLPFNNLSYTVNSSSSFTVESNEPVITGFSPASAKAGDLVTINGQNFGGAISDNSIMFNGKPASIITFSSTQITAKVPVGATSGKIMLFTKFNNLVYTVSSPFDFIVESSQPVITGFSPLSAAPGTTVTITGNNFRTTTSDNSVFFNGVEATVISSSPTSLVVTVPVTATSGKVIVSVMVDAIEYTVTSTEDFIVVR